MEKKVYWICFVDFPGIAKQVCHVVLLMKINEKAY